VRGAERHVTVATPAAFAKCEGEGLGAVKSVLTKGGLVKVAVSVTSENGDKCTSSPAPLPAFVWSEVYANK